MNKSEMLHQTARLWLDPDQRDVAEIRLDDLLDPTAEDAIEEIWEVEPVPGCGVRHAVCARQESGTVTRIVLGGSIVRIPA